MPNGKEIKPMTIPSVMLEARELEKKLHEALDKYRESLLLSVGRASMNRRDRIEAVRMAVALGIRFDASDHVPESIKNQWKPYTEAHIPELSAEMGGGTASKTPPPRESGGRE